MSPACPASPGRGREPGAWRRWLRRGGRARRVWVGLLLVAGGLLGFLPVLGFWMLPLGLLLLAAELPGIGRPLRRGLVRARRRCRRWRSGA